MNRRNGVRISTNSVDFLLLFNSLCTFASKTLNVSYGERVAINYNPADGIFIRVPGLINIDPSTILFAFAMIHHFEESL